MSCWKRGGSNKTFIPKPPSHYTDINLLLQLHGQLGEQQQKHRTEFLYKWNLILCNLSGLHSHTQWSWLGTWITTSSSSEVYQEGKFSTKTNLNIHNTTAKRRPASRIRILLVCCAKLSIISIISSKLEDKLTCGLKRNFVESGQNLRR